jgi:hypothetical protein
LRIDDRTSRGATLIPILITTCRPKMIMSGLAKVEMSS